MYYSTLSCPQDYLEGSAVGYPVTKFTTIDRNLNPPSLLTASRKGEANVLVSFFFRSD